MSVSSARARWLGTIDAHWDAREGPNDEQYWSRYDTISSDELRAVQERKLEELVRFAAAEIPFYRHKFDAAGIEPGDVTTLDDLARLPITTKQEMAEDLSAHEPWGTYTSVDDTVWRERGWQIFASSGTTARPRMFRYTSLDRQMWSWTNARAMWAMGFRPGRDSALIASGYGPHVFMWGVHYALDLMGIPIVTAGGVDTRMRARFVGDFEPTILVGTPSYALYLAHVMREQGLDPAASSVRKILVGGEPALGIPATRQRLEEVWDAELVEFYGCTEASPSTGGYTCAEVAAEKHGEVSTHLMGDTQIWETIDPETHERVPDGERGLTVVTNLCSEASPQIRFLVGDFTTLTHETCRCGRTHPRGRGGFVGRADDMLNIRGVTLFPSALEDAVRHVPELGDEFEIVVSTHRGLDELTIRAEVPADLDTAAREALAEKTVGEVRARCELRAGVELLDEGTLPRTQFKAKRVRDQREDHGA